MPRNTKKKSMDVQKAVLELSSSLIGHIRKNLNSRDACLLLMLLELWRQAVESKKIDAVAMGAYGMQHFFESAPEDCGRIIMALIESENVPAAIGIFPKDDPDNDPDPGDGKVKLN